jgi:sugar O-acyltransferase (sialic acid O-acetyltransferase NeuD family)
MEKIAIVGSGEMALHIAFYIEQQNKTEVVGFYDDFKGFGENVGKYKVIGNTNQIISDFKNKKFEKLLIAVGYTRFSYRKNIYEKFKDNIPFALYIHESCYIAPDVKIGRGCVIFPGCVIDKNVVLEDNIFIHIGCRISHDTILEKHSYFAPNVSIAGHVRIGEMCNIGIGTIVSDRITICNNVQTGAGAVVVKNISESGVYIGIPAQKIK